MSKQSSTLERIAIPILVAIFTTGTAPWWWNRVFGDKSGSSLSAGNEPSPTTSSTNQLNYAWLSQRLVTEKDLEGKSGYDLDIMRNWVFASHGRRFETDGLQAYFNRQSWYRPKYLPQKFPENLLSTTERQNVKYIASFQDRYGLRHFKK
jgi:serine/threonine protein kinase, bacterial